MLTDPSQAAEFVEKSGCDSLAVAIGDVPWGVGVHRQEGLHFDVLEQIPARPTERVHRQLPKYRATAERFAFEVPATANFPAEIDIDTEVDDGRRQEAPP